MGSILSDIKVNPSSQQMLNEDLKILKYIDNENMDQNFILFTFATGFHYSAIDLFLLI